MHQRISKTSLREMGGRWGIYGDRERRNEFRNSSGRLVQFEADWLIQYMRLDTLYTVALAPDMIAQAHPFEMCLYRKTPQ